MDEEADERWGLPLNGRNSFAQSTGVDGLGDLVLKGGARDAQELGGPSQVALGFGQGPAQNAALHFLKCLLQIQAFTGTEMDGHGS